MALTPKNMWLLEPICRENHWTAVKTLGMRLISGEAAPWDKSFTHIEITQHKPSCVQWAKYLLCHDQDELQRARVYDYVYLSIFCYWSNPEPSSRIGIRSSILATTVPGRLDLLCGTCMN